MVPPPQVAPLARWYHAGRGPQSHRGTTDPYPPVRMVPTPCRKSDPPPPVAVVPCASCTPAFLGFAPIPRSGSSPFFSAGRPLRSSHPIPLLLALSLRLATSPFAPNSCLSPSPALCLLRPRSLHLCPPPPPPLYDVPLLFASRCTLLPRRPWPAVPCRSSRPAVLPLPALQPVTCSSFAPPCILLPDCSGSLWHPSSSGHARPVRP